MEQELNTLANLASLSTLKYLTNNVSPISTQLTSIENKINQIPATDLSGINARLSTIENKIDSLQLSQAGLVFTPLALNPSYQPNSKIGWVVAPTSLQNITDGDVNSSTNQFEISGTANIWGEIVINPGITIPSYTRINLKVGIATNSSGQFPAAQLEAFIANKWVGLWGFFGTSVTNTDASQLIQDIESFASAPWTALRFRIWDLGFYGSRARIYDLKVFAVS